MTTPPPIEAFEHALLEGMLLGHLALQGISARPVMDGEAYTAELIIDLPPLGAAPPMSVHVVVLNPSGPT